MLEEYNELLKKEINQEKVTKVTKVYGKLDEPLKKLISNIDTNFIYIDENEYRFISFDEIMEANEILSETLYENKLIPLIDCMENDFICYDNINKKWVVYNIIEEIIFASEDTFEDLLNTVQG